MRQFENAETPADGPMSSRCSRGHDGIEYRVPVEDSTADGTWEMLFDGTSLEGWTMAGPGGFILVDGALETRGGMGLLWYERRAFGDFELTLQWRVSSRADNAGVFVRFPDPRGDPWDAVRHGYEIQVQDDAPTAETRTGAIYGRAGPDCLLSRPVGTWNDLRVSAVGHDYRVEVNGLEAVRFTGDRESAGFIGLQNHDARSRVAFRNIRVRQIREASTHNGTRQARGDRP